MLIWKTQDDKIAWFVFFFKKNKKLPYLHGVGECHAQVLTCNLVIRVTLPSSQSIYTFLLLYLNLKLLLKKRQPITKLIKHVSCNCTLHFIDYDIISPNHIVSRHSLLSFVCPKSQASYYTRSINRVMHK